MESKVGFLGGMDRDSSVSKRDPNKYYDALNIRVLTDDGLSTGSVINEKGNSLLFKLPTLLPPVFTISVNGFSADTLEIWFNEYAHTDVLFSSLDITSMYSTIITNAGVIDDIANGLYNVFLSGDLITIVGLASLHHLVCASSTIVETVSATSNLKIIGLGTMRDWVVIFTTDTNVLPLGTSSIGNGQIWKCKYDQVNEIIENLSVNYLVPSTHLVYNGILGFNMSYRVGEVVSRYQDSTHGKIFFIDGLNTMKHINILDPESLGLPLSSIDIVPDIIFSQPKITKVIKGGALKSGSIQYSYQLFNQGGSESSFAPASGIVHLTDKSEYGSTTSDYKGTASETSVGKSVKIQIDNIDTNFDYIRLISVFYTSQEGQPEISIIEEKPVPSTGSIEFTDNGNPIGVYSVTEYNTTGNRVFIPGTITTKNNYLIAANIKEEYFDVDETSYWDARAYRWDSTGTTFKVDGVDTHVNPSLIDELADCVLDRTDQTTYAYNPDTPTIALGGKGTNVSYEFVLTPIKIDSDADDTRIFTNIDVPQQNWGTRIDSSYADNDSYTSYASPINRAQLEGYTRDEIYRFAIEFEDTKGRNSFAKWIGDIKFPSIMEVDTKVTYYTDVVTQNVSSAMYDYNTVFQDTTNGGIYANVLGIKFTVNNVPAGLSYRIVRVRREQADKYILGQGLAGWAHIIDINEVQPYNNTTADTISMYSNIDTDQYFVTFKSPEVLFTNSIEPQYGDSVEIAAITDVTAQGLEYFSADNVDVWVTKIKSLVPPLTKQTAIVEDGIKVEDMFKTNPTFRYVIANGGTRSRYLNHFDAYKGSCAALGLNGVLDIASATAETAKYIILNYTKDSSYVQYGGNNYYARINNPYIACGSLTTGTACTVYGGDTFIGMFEYINAMMWTSSLISAAQRTEIVYIPLESTINVEVKHGTSYSKDNASNRLCETAAFGNLIYPDTYGGIYPADYTDVYQYNTAYSAEPIGKTYSVKPQFFQNNQVNDYRVIVSEKHINNQLSDGWTKFLYNNQIEVNSAYGSINKIITFRNQLFFFQDNAFGILGFEDRQLLKDNTGSQLTLGVGTILPNFRYISEKTGTKSKFGVIDTGSYLYFVDLNNRKFMRFTGETDQCVSDKNNLSSFFRVFDYGDALLFDSTANSLGIHGVFDPINKRVLFSLLGADSATFSFNEVLDNFESFYSFKPTIYENTDFGVISVNPANLGECYLHTKGLRGVWYGTAYDSYITHILAPNPDNKKVFTNLDYNSYVEVSGVDVPLETINSIQLWNSFQDTGVVPLTQPTNIRRRFRTWRYQVPRVNSLRMMDYALFSKLSFTNSSITDTYFRLDDITTHYLVPMI